MTRIKFQFNFRNFLVVVIFIAFALRYIIITINILGLFLLPCVLILYIKNFRREFSANSNSSATSITAGVCGGVIQGIIIKIVKIFHYNLKLMNEVASLIMSYDEPILINLFAGFLAGVICISCIKSR